MRKLCIVSVAAVAALMSTSSVGRANSKVFGESVSNFGGNGDLPNAIANTQRFLDRIVQRGEFQLTTTPCAGHCKDSLVFDADFMDPDLADNVPFTNDSANFDQPDLAISFVTAHGSAPPPPPADCTNSGQCTSFVGGRCFYTENTTQQKGACGYPIDHAIFVNGSFAANFNFALYNGPRLPGEFPGSTHRYMAFGESPQSGSWAAAGTNGGVNLVVMNISFGAFYYSLFSDLGPTLAGVHLVATVMPTGGDTADVPGRGRMLADQYMANPGGSVANAWLNVVRMLPEGGNGPCPMSNGGIPDHPPGGINGCGGHVIVGGDTVSGPCVPGVVSHLFENWADIRNDNLDARSNACMNSLSDFNFDYNRFPVLHDNDKPL